MASKICTLLLNYFPIIGSKVPFVGCFESYYCEDFRSLFVVCTRVDFVMIEVCRSRPLFNPYLCRQLYVCYFLFNGFVNKSVVYLKG